LALQEVNLTIQPGTVTAVVGPNGAGKSTMFALISGRIQPSAGSVYTCGPVAEVLQATTIDPQLSITVDDVVRMARYPTCGILGRIQLADREACHEALDRVDLLHLRRRPIHELSGGERQRALLAQGIAQDAPILLLDEPAAGLDVPSQQRVLDVIRAEADGGRAVLFSTHHLPDATYADTVVALACRCVCCAPPSAALLDSNVTALFAARPLKAPLAHQPRVAM